MRKTARENTTGYPSKRKKEDRKCTPSLPVFPGGESALLAYVAQHLKYPEQAKKDRVEGVVLLRFVVLENGHIGEVQTIKSLEPHCDAEAKRVIKTLPPFAPSKQQGKAVRVWYTLPIRFMIR